MKKINVKYSSGESRTNPGKAVDYMIATLGNEDGYEIDEIYAEADPVEGDETGTYEELRAEILSQAKDAGVPADILQFWYD